MPNLTRILSDVLHRPSDALRYELSRRLAELYPDKHILETEDYDFDLDTFFEDGLCAVRPHEDAHLQLGATWIDREKGIEFRTINGLLEVAWQGRRFLVLQVRYDNGGDTDRRFLVADSEAAARDFFAAVCAHASEVRGEILVFERGWWSKDRELMAQIQKSTFDGLVLPPALRDQLIHDFEGFFAAREQYARYGIAWKRGVLLLGPPGNGKTHAIKALINRLGKPCLYVRSFQVSRGTVAEGISRVFARARQAAPCLVVLEDLDSLVERRYLSYFLNEMDGFAANEGILVVATTNHPERLDPALLERPSRFDRKIAFALPAEEERLRFLNRLTGEWEPEMRISPEDLAALAHATAGFSFAYLKELAVSGMMAWMRAPQPGQMGPTMQTLVSTLRRQMRTERQKSAERDREPETSEDES